MDNFYVLNKSVDFTNVNEYFAGYVLFFKKSKDEKTVEIQLSLLNKLIQNALKLNVDNFLFIDLNTQNVRLATLRKSIKIEKCFLFGVQEAEIGTNIVISNYQLKSVADIQFLKVDAPEKLEQNKTLKNKLWEQLQISFNLN